MPTIASLGPAFGAASAAIVVPFVLGWLMRSVRAEARKQGGVAWLDYGVVMKGLALFFVGVVAAVIVLWFNVAPKDRGAVLILIALFGGLTLPLVLEFFLVRIGFDDARIYCHSGWRKSRVVPWDDVVSAEFSPGMGWWIIRTKHSGVIRASAFLTGLGEFIAEIRRRGITVSDPRVRPRPR